MEARTKRSFKIAFNELLELVSAVPKLHRMDVLLKGHEWEEGHEDEDEDGDGDESFRAVSTGTDPIPHNDEA
jgi:hypothetical protein